MDDYDEAALARKLAERWQLNVPERRSLPDSGLSASALVSAIHEILAEASCYPRDWRPDEASYDGALIKSTQHGFEIHERHEIGVGRFSPAQVQHVATLEQAVLAFLKATFEEDNMDGIRIDWHR
jgi:hypothetical protein